METELVETLRRDPSDGEVGGEWTASSGPDGTDDGGCERDWGFETRPRHSSRSGHDNSASGAELGDVGVLDDTLTMDVTDDDKLAGGRLSGRAFSFSHYTTEGIFIHGDPPLGSLLEPPRPRAATSETRDHALEWEFSLTIPGNCVVAARNRGSGKIPWHSLALGVSTLPDANALYRGKSVKRLLRHRSDCRGWRK